MFKGRGCLYTGTLFFLHTINNVLRAMKIRFYTFTLLMGLLLFLNACSHDEAIPVLDIHTQPNELILEPQINASVSVRFTSSAAWQAKTNVDWVVLSPTKGEAGDISLSLLVKEENRTGEERTGILTLISAGITKEVKFTQKMTDVLNVEQTSYNVAADGGIVKIAYSTNLSNCKFRLVADGEFPQWIVVEQSETKALQTREFSLTVLTNRVLSQRTSNMQIYAVDAQNEDNVLLKSARITIRQDAAQVGTSTDLATYDKKVFVLQKHTEGNGVPIVFMGDGFLDKDVENGYYRTVMEKSMELFFTEEPVKSLRNYFDVWMVTAVSQNNAFGGSYSTRFNCQLEGGGSTGISGNHTMVKTYAALVPELNSEPQLLNETMSIVILNTEAYAGTTYFGFSNQIGNTIEFSIGYCPIIYGLDNEMFRRVLCHECIGHGFAKLLDEYSYEQQGVIPASEIEKSRRMQQQLGWAMNVDFTNNRETVLWKHFLNDSRYQGKDLYGEELGVYEGACTYWRGAWRPTVESMMRSNTHGFNAPSREAIYKRIMKLAYGSLWVYDYESFVDFDRTHLPQPIDTRFVGDYSEMNKPFAAPRFVGEALP